MKKSWLLLPLIAACAVTPPNTSNKEQPSLALGSYITNDLTAGENNDYEPQNTSASAYYLPNSAGSILTGIDHNYYNDAEGFIVRNATTGAATITLKHESTSSVAGNRFHFRDGQDITLEPGDSVFLQRAVDYESGGYQQIGTQLAPRISAIANNSRTLGSTFQPSTKRPTLVHYSVTVANTLTLTGGQAGRVELRVGTSSSLSGSDTVARVDAGNTGTLTLGLTLVSTVGGELSYLVPAGDWVEVVGVNVTSTPTYALVAQSEETL